MKKLIGLLFLLILLLFLPIFNCFTISNGSTDQLVFVGKIKDFENFDVDFTHSVNKTPVKEFYKIKGKGFNLYKAEFSSYGAGMSDGMDIDRAKISHGENNEIYLDLDDDFEIITYYVGTVADHRINYKDKTLHLNQLLEVKSPAVLALKRLSIFDILKVGK
ncbi:DUF1850 domain-containing protein [Neofamilia massiliensis]|uniref:DUF1850 domain-containing protein n=1 Tax=Neofamilia massiliensis TaxID=1673724 RepID=UPI0006BB7D22|nr:DUF1850 domain-containing protein [Neofamilia massiliensis]